jgi:predicted ribosome quality control (RQC) complex YloA/Tae2 family protein
MIVATSRDLELAKGTFKTRGTTQAAIDEQKRIDHEQKEMEKSMKELEQKAKEQEKRQQEKGSQVADDLF